MRPILHLLHKTGYRLAAAGSCAIVASACGPGTFAQQTGLSRFALFNNNQQAQGARPVLDEPFEQVDLIALLECSGESSAPPRGRKRTGCPEETDVNDARLSEGFARFYVECLSRSSSCKLARNRVQERIIAASEQRCSGYKQWIRQFKAEGDFSLGTVATTLAGLGAIFTGAGTVRALSGAAAIVSGTRAEFDQALFSNLAVQVITKGIDARRVEISKQIEGRQDRGIDAYTVEAAIADALEYHGACSVLSGLEYAQFALDVVNEVRNPGLLEIGALLSPNRVGVALTGVIDAETTRTELEKKVEDLSKRAEKLENADKRASLKKRAEEVVKALNEAKSELEKQRTAINQANEKASTAKAKLSSESDASKRTLLNKEIEAANGTAGEAAAKVDTIMAPLKQKVADLASDVDAAERE